MAVALGNRADFGEDASESGAAARVNNAATQVQHGALGRVDESRGFGDGGEIDRGGRRLDKELGQFLDIDYLRLHILRDVDPHRSRTAFAGDDSILRAPEGYF